MPDQSTIQNADLVLSVTGDVDPAIFDISRYEPFIDALCGNREYQKDAIRTVLQYFLGGKYQTLTDLARENWHANTILHERYSTFQEMERHLQLPNKLSCSVDLATGSGKSYVMYGVARIMLAHGAVDRVLTLCPSVTIEKGLTQKFRELSEDAMLKELLPEDSRILVPHIANGTETVVEGTICIENDDAVLRHVQSSIRSSLMGKGAHTLVLNDEVHHVYTSGQTLRRWKEFLIDPDFGFRFLAGFSGTCYVDDDYFSDVVSRYSLRDAIEQGYVKSIDYVAEDTSSSADEKFQKIYDNHQYNRSFYRQVKPLTILITRDIAACRRLTTEVIDFLSKQEGISVEDAAQKTLIVTSAAEHMANVRRLESVDRPDNPVEWITSVSMLTEGWDVQNVFQIVPHEERAFNSKLLIAQVLGRGLRVPQVYRGERPVVIVFNHDSWSGRIKHLVDEIMEIDKRVNSMPVTKTPDYNFTLANIDYSRIPEIENYQQKGEYEFTKGYVTLVSQSPSLERETVYARATTDTQRSRRVNVRYQMHPLDDVARHIHNKFAAVDIEKGTNYAEKYTFEWLQELIRKSLRMAGENEDRVSEDNRQRLQRAVGVLNREGSQTARYQSRPTAIIPISTANRQRNGVGVSSLRRFESTIFLDSQSIELSDDETRTVLNEILEDDTLPISAYERVMNQHYFKTPLNVVITSHRPERDFVKRLVRQENANAVDAWIKSTDQDFYRIEYAWRKGEHSKIAMFNPDFFLKVGDHIVVVEIKSDDELHEPSDENKAKYRTAKQHFDTLNGMQQDFTYHFHFLTPQNYDMFFTFLREGNFNFVSELDVVLAENGA